MFLTNLKDSIKIKMSLEIICQLEANYGKQKVFASNWQNELVHRIFPCHPYCLQTPIQNQVSAKKQLQILPLYTARSRCRSESRASLHKGYEKIYLHESLTHDLGFNVLARTYVFLLLSFVCLFLQWFIETKFWRYPRVIKDFLK